MEMQSRVSEEVLGMPMSCCVGCRISPASICEDRWHWGKWFRECPPPCGLLLDLAKPQVHATPFAPVPSVASDVGVPCMNTLVTMLADSGWRGAQRSGIKEEPTGRGTAA